MLVINPAIIHQKIRLLASGASNNVLNTLVPGRFQVTNEGRSVIYAEKISRKHKNANNLFIANFSSTCFSAVTTAAANSPNEAPIL